MTESDFLVSLCGPFAPTFNPVGASFMARARSRLPPTGPPLSFWLAFDDILVIPDGSAEPAVRRVSHGRRRCGPIPCETLALDHHRTEYLVRFSDLRLDADTERISGELNLHLSAPWLQLASEFTPADLEALLMLRWANRRSPC